jgi:hypothetical protein
MQSIERTKQIANQFQSHTLQRNYADMAPTNNAELQMDKVFPVKDKVALVTGGGSGIGLMITQTLAVNGAKVYIVGRTEEKLEKVVEAHGQNIAGQVSFIILNAYEIYTNFLPLDYPHCRRCQHQGGCIEDQEGNRVKREVRMHPRQQRRYCARQDRGEGELR